ncbi:MAG: HAD family hydrolase [Myxococcaceae bacterium]
MTSSPIHALIFDLDGTLADSIGDIGTAMNEVLRGLGLREHSLTDYKRFVGEGAEVLVRRAVAASRGEEVERVTLPRPVAELCEAYRVAYAKLEHAQSAPYPGIAGLLGALQQRGTRLAVLSNKRDDFTRHLVEHAFPEVRFADVRGEREGVPRKPDPTAAFELSLALDVMPHRIGFVGDTAIDMKTAVNAGMIPIGVLWGFRSREELVGAGARHLLAQPSDLLALL